jgi:hypothetical protein
VPNIVGIKEWADRFPGRIIHAREYRRPEVFAKETILIVGAAVRVTTFKILMQSLIDFFRRVVVKSHEISSNMQRRFINQSGYDTFILIELYIQLTFHCM